MSSVIYSNRRDFLLIIEINLILWVFFFLGFFGLFQCLSVLYFNAKFKTNHGILFKKNHFPLLINIQCGDVLGIQSRDM